MIILGIDPGSRLTGYGIIDKNGNHHRHIENGTLYLEKQGAYPHRLGYLFEQIQILIEAYEPEVLAIENIFYHKNPKSIQKLGEVRGVAMASAVLKGLPVFEYAPLEVKKSITGYGAAKKEQVQFMICKLLNLKDCPEENAADALGIALCHANSYNLLTKVRKVGRVTASNELLKKASFYR